MNILITGASTGIGRALAERMSAQGHSVWGIARQKEALEKLKQTLGENFSFSCIDITNTQAVKDAVHTMNQAGFVPDAVVLNAGIYPHDSDESFRFDIAERILATNVNGALVFVDLFLPVFVQRRSGQFLAVSSVLAVRPDPLGAAYAASKAALTMAFRSLALRFGKNGVRFSCVLLGPILTGVRKKPFLSFHLKTTDQAAQALEHALTRKGTLLYYPWFLGVLFKALWWVPDTVFDALTQPFRR